MVGGLPCKTLLQLIQEVLLAIEQEAKGQEVAHGATINLDTGKTPCLGPSGLGCGDQRTTDVLSFRVSLRQCQVFPDRFVGRNGPELTQRQHRFFSRFGFFTCGGCKVPSAKTDADFFQKSCRWFAASKYPNIVVGEHLRLACHIEHHGILFDLHRVGIEEHFQFSLAHAFLEALRVALLDACEGRLAIRECANALEVPETGTTVCLKEGKRRVQDGPYAETKEQLAGFIILELPSIDAQAGQVVCHCSPCDGITHDTELNLKQVLFHLWRDLKSK
jgi:hypothetical protein